MENSVIKNRDDEINVEEIMDKIRENIRRRQVPEVSSIVSTDGAASPPAYPELAHSREALQYDINNINSLWNIQNSRYQISSHRPLLGKLLVHGRKAVHGEVTRYVDPVFSRQTQFNGSVVRILNESAKSISVILDVSAKKFADLEREIREQKCLINQFHEETEQKIREITDRLDGHDSLVARVGSLESALSSVQEQVRVHDGLISRVEDLESALSSIQEQVRVHDGLISRVDNLEPALSSVQEQVRVHDGLISRVDDSRVSDQRELLSLINKTRETVDINIDYKVSNRLMEVFSDIRHDIENKAWLAGVLEKRIAKGFAEEYTLPKASGSDTPSSLVNYFVFEDRFRGGREDIKKRQEVYLPFFSGCKKVLDIGCGRGEFLELLQDNGIGAVGIDVDPTMIDYCTARGFQVTLADAISYLSSLPDESLDGINMSQVIEHLDQGYMIELLSLCAKKLKYGFYYTVETVNPLSFFSHANFYIDLSHIRPIHPETLSFLFTSVGLRNVEIRFSSPVPEQEALQLLPGAGDAPDGEKWRIETYNNNIRMLNSRIFGAQDYTVIGKK